MKSALLITILLFFLGCDIQEKEKNKTKSKTATEKPLLLKYVNQNDSVSKIASAKKHKINQHYIESDSLIIPTEIGETLRFGKKEINEIIENHPEFFEESISSPDLTHHKYVKSIDFSSEAGKDIYYALYAYFLKQKNGVKKYGQQRLKLIGIYSKINSLFGNIQHGGTYFGHQGIRILGYAEYAIYIMPKEGERLEKTYNISKQKELYIKSLRQLIADEDKVDFNTITKEKSTRRKKLNKIIDELDKSITDLFYLRQAQQFQYVNYEYY